MPFNIKSLLYLLAFVGLLVSCTQAENNVPNPATEFSAALVANGPHMMNTSFAVYYDKTLQRRRVDEFNSDCTIKVTTISLFAKSLTYIYHPHKNQCITMPGGTWFNLWDYLLAAKPSGTFTLPDGSKCNLWLYDDPNGSIFQSCFKSNTQAWFEMDFKEGFTTALVTAFNEGFPSNAYDVPPACNKQ